MITDTDCDDVSEVKKLLNRMGIRVDKANELNVMDEDGYYVDIGTERHYTKPPDGIDVIQFEYIMENWRTNR